MKLLVTDFAATYRATTAFRLPVHGGSLLRGVFGRALRRSACLVEPACAGDCASPGRCAYTRLFDPPVPEPLPHRFLRGATGAPPPIVPIFPPAGARDVAPGDRLDIGLRVLGPLTVDDGARLLAAVEGFADFPLRAGGDPADDRRAGRVELVESRQSGPRRRPVAIVAGAPEEGRLDVDFETPVSLVHAHDPLEPDAVDFKTLFRHVFRRLTVLCALYGELGPDADDMFRTLDARAGEVRTESRRLRLLRWERLSLERSAKDPVSGLVGSIAFEGPVGAFLSTMRAAEIAHVGKSTIYGLGRIRVTARRAVAAG